MTTTTTKVNESVVEDLDVPTELQEKNNHPAVNVSKKESKWKKIQQTRPDRLFPSVSPSEIKLTSLIDELRKFTYEEDRPSSIAPKETFPLTFREKFQKFRLKVKSLLLHNRFHYFIILLVLTDLLVVLVDLILGQDNTFPLCPSDRSIDRWCRFSPIVVAVFRRRGNASIQHQRST